jgi:hypothetical protein
MQIYVLTDNNGAIIRRNDSSVINAIAPQIGANTPERVIPP